jgi:sialate O-acetylesterase
MIIIFALPFMVSCEYHKDQVRSLQGQWKFSIGDNKNWAKPDFDDSKWEKIYVPSKWEDEGFVGYNGFAWYRKNVRIPKKLETSSLYLHLGRIDDSDEVYFNGTLIGNTGSMPPSFKGAYEETRRYFIPRNLIQFNKENVIAVRVYDYREGGGIRNGNIGIFQQDELSVDFDLSGHWKFQLFDSLQWKDELYDDSGWKTINVPSTYENQGFEDYDGFSWYRKTFDLPVSLIDKKLVLVLGKIDDIDEVYINGKLAGGLGEFKSTPDSINIESYWDEFRGYYLPDNIVLKDKGNVIAVRIFDKEGNGGIYEGPVGLVDQNNYSTYWENIRKRRW